VSASPSPAPRRPSSALPSRPSGPLSSLFSSWRTALRVARREARRAKGRSLLVVAMIALPVLCLTFAAVSYDMFNLTGDERAERWMGAADARIGWDQREAVDQTPDGVSSWPTSPPTTPPQQPAKASIGDPSQGTGSGETPPPTEADLLTVLPAGTHTLGLAQGSVALRTATGQGELQATAVDATSPLTRGLVEVVRGRAPHAPSEVALTTEAARRLGAGVGGSITTADGATTYAVVGEVEFPIHFGQVVLFSPTSDQAARMSRQWLVETPPGTVLDWVQVRRLNQLGIVVASRDVYLHPPTGSEVPSPFDRTVAGVVIPTLSVSVIVGGLALLEVVLLAGPAFAVSARRRQRQLALVAANGGTPAHVRRIVLADGIVLGLAGALAGIGAGIPAAFAARPFIEEYIRHARAGAYRIFPAALAAVAALAVVIGVLAAAERGRIPGRPPRRDPLPQTLAAARHRDGRGRDRHRRGRHAAGVLEGDAGRSRGRRARHGAVYAGHRRSHRPARASTALAAADRAARRGAQSGGRRPGHLRGAGGGGRQCRDRSLYRQQSCPDRG
jgi:putative ABC transport system permease protein